jgi:iduronate 2-sulfatase
MRMNANVNNAGLRPGNIWQGCVRKWCWIIALVFLATGVAHPAQGQSPSPPRKNVLMIVVDDLRPQLGAYGHAETLTPQMDRLAADGVVFRRAYCQVPVCGASRASLMTGIRPDFTDPITSNGRFYGAGSRADREAPSAITLPRHFKNHGYYTLSNGKVFHVLQDSQSAWSEAPWWPHYGSLTEDFDHVWLDPDSRNHINPNTGRGPYFEIADVPDDAYPDGKIAMKSIADLRRLKGTNQPFFLACGFLRPHLPFNAPKRYYDLYDLAGVQIADNRFMPTNAPGALNNSSEIGGYGKVAGRWPCDMDFHREARRAYYASVSYIDALIGLLVDELKALELYDSTLIVIWGDHGWHLGEHNFWGKHNTLNNALHSPLIVRAPGSPGGVQTSALVEFVDVYPSLCDLAGLPYPAKQLHGTSFVPLMLEPNRQWKEAVFSEWHVGKARAVKTDRYLYTEFGNGARMLFDHEADPQENNNIAGLPENAPVVAHLSGLIAQLYAPKNIANASGVVASEKVNERGKREHPVHR